MTNKPDGVLYVGVTSDLARRVWEHREGLAEGFTKKYRLKRLVYVEEYPGIQDAIAQEKKIKNRSRAWKVERIVRLNPGWDDLYANLQG